MAAKIFFLYSKSKLFFRKLDLSQRSCQVAFIPLLKKIQSFS